MKCRILHPPSPFVFMFSVDNEVSTVYAWCREVSRSARIHYDDRVLAVTFASFHLLELLLVAVMHL
jgi:beta-galactosidase/beta-glucuronidase